MFSGFLLKAGLEIAKENTILYSLSISAETNNRYKGILPWDKVTIAVTFIASVFSNEKIIEAANRTFYRAMVLQHSTRTRTRI